MKSMNEWKDLEIENIPEFIKKAIKVQKLVDGQWVDIKGLKSSIVYDVVEPSISTKYRYALKPLEPIRITKNVEKWLLHYSSLPECIIQDGAIHGDMLLSLDNRTVEIIEETT